MQATVREVGDVSVVDLFGKITIGRGDIALRESVNDLLHAGQRKILINLSGVTYMDSCGLGELAACYRNAKDHGATVKLLNPTGRVFDLLQMIKLEEVIDSFRDETEAVLAFERTRRGPAGPPSGNGGAPEPLRFGR